MRKIIVSTFLTMDGVLQAPGGPEEDRTNGFKWGGWMFYSRKKRKQSIQNYQTHINIGIPTKFGCWCTSSGVK